MRKILTVSAKILLAFLGLFGVVFSIYFFNLDMKFMAYAVEPLLQKLYDAKKRKQYV